MRMLLACALAVASTACGDVVPKQVPEAGAGGEAGPMGCTTSTDCTDPAAKVCATADGICVGCLTAGDCSAAAPVCDMTGRSCRTCTMDSECPGGVCIEADGTCSADADVAFVTMMGADSAACTRTAPCATIQHALTVGRHIIHVLGGSLFSSPVTLNTDTILDGETTTLSVGTASSTIAIPTGVNVLVEGFRVTAPSSGMTPPPAISLGGPGHLRLYNMQLSGDNATLVLATQGTLEISRSHLGSLTQSSANHVYCQNATAKLDQDQLEMTIVGDNGTECELRVTRTRFESSRDGSVQLGSGRLVMENNLIIHSDGFNDSVSLGNLGTGSTFRYNTIVNTTALPSDGAALSCNSTLEVTSNIFAYNSGHPITGSGCMPKYSVFDDQALTGAGTGNQLVPIDSIFANRAAGDYHLAASSAAKVHAEPGQTMTTVDFDGKARPNPAGSTADSGAFEAP